MAYDDRSVKPMGASLMRARIATRVLAGLAITVLDMGSPFAICRHQA